MVAEHHHLLALLSDELEIAVESGLQDGMLQVRQLVADGKVKGRYGQEVVGFRHGSKGSQAIVWRVP